MSRFLITMSICALYSMVSLASEECNSYLNGQNFQNILETDFGYKRKIQVILDSNRFYSNANIDKVLAFINLIDPTKRSHFISNILTINKLIGNSPDGDLQNRFIRFLNEDLSKVHPISVTMEFGLERALRYKLYLFFSTLTGYGQPSDDFTTIEKGFLSLLNGDKWFDGSVKALSKKTRDEIFDAYLRVINNYHARLSINHPSVKIQEMISAKTEKKISVEVSQFLKFINFSNKKDREMLEAAAIDNKEVSDVIYHIMNSVLVFFNSSQSFGFDFLAWSQAPSVFRAWTPENVRAAIEKAKLLNPGGIDHHGENIVVEAKEALFRLVYHIQKGDLKSNSFFSKKMSYENQVKNLIVVSIYSGYRTLWGRLGIEHKNAILVSALAASNADVEMKLKKYLQVLSDSQGKVRIIDSNLKEEMSYDVNQMSDSVIVDPKWIEYFEQLISYNVFVPFI